LCVYYWFVFSFMCVDWLLLVRCGNKSIWLCTCLCLGIGAVFLLGFPDVSLSSLFFPLVFCSVSVLVLFCILQDCGCRSVVSYVGGALSPMILSTVVVGWFWSIFTDLSAASTPIHKDDWGGWWWWSADCGRWHRHYGWPFPSVVVDTKIVMMVVGLCLFFDDLDACCSLCAIYVEICVCCICYLILMSVNPNFSCCLVFAFGTTHYAMYFWLWWWGVNLIMAWHSLQPWWFGSLKAHEPHRYVGFSGVCCAFGLIEELIEDI